MSSFIAQGIEFLKESTNPEYVAQKRQAREYVEDAKMKAEIALVASIALAILSIAVVASGGTAAIVFFAVALPVAFFAYNIRQVCNNFLEVLDNPSFFQNNLGIVSASLNKDKLIEQLKKETFGFEYFIKEGIQQLEDNRTVRKPILDHF